MKVFPSHSLHGLSMKRQTGLVEQRLRGASHHIALRTWLIGTVLGDRQREGLRLRYDRKEYH